VAEAATTRGEPGAVRPLRVLILNQPFHPDVVATAQIATDLADALVARGHSVTAIASRSIYGDTGATLPKFESVDGVEIRRVGSARFGRRSTLGRLIDFAGYYCQALVKGLRLERFDVVICLTTPPYIALVGLLIRSIRGGRVVYWLMDVYPDVMIAHGMLREGSILHRVLRWLHHRVLESVDATIALGRCMRDRLVAQGVAP
jgi:glycosyltransferase involved in cell wall biosynthesis